MAWIELHEELPDHPKTDDLMDRLSVSRPTAVGILTMSWLWILKFAQDGIIPAKRFNSLVKHSGWEGTAEEYAAGMVGAEWLHVIDGGHTVHDWHDYAGKLIERRERNKNSMRESRAKQSANTCETRDNTCKATVPNQTVPNQPNQTEPEGVARATDPPPLLVLEGGKTEPNDLDPEFAKVCHAYQNNIAFLTGMASERLASLCDEYSPTWVLHAISEAVRYNKLSMAYVESILKRLKRDGFKATEAPAMGSKADTAPQVLAASIAHYEAFAAKMPDAAPVQIYRAYAAQFPDVAVIHNPDTPYPMIRRQLPERKSHA